jgi:uncharacterized membrane protein
MSRRINPPFWGNLRIVLVLFNKVDNCVIGALVVLFASVASHTSNDKNFNQ